MAEGAGFSGRYANKPLPDVSGVRFGLKLLLVSAGIIVVGESLPAARQPVPCLDAEKRFRLLSTNFTAPNAPRARARARALSTDPPTRRFDTTRRKRSACVSVEAFRSARRAAFSRLRSRSWRSARTIQGSKTIGTNYKINGLRVE